MSSLLRAAALTLVCSCSPYDPNLSGTPFLCGSADMACPDGYACVVTGGRSVCTSEAGSAGGDAGSGSGSGSGTCTMPFSGVLATWTFVGQPGTQTATNAATTATGVTASAITRAPALAAAAGLDSISAGGWPQSGALDSQSYFTASVTAPTGCHIVITQIDVDAKASNTGPAMAAVGTSADAFAATVPVSTTTPSSPALTATATGQLEVRFFGFAATATGGTLRIQNMLGFTGRVQ